MPEIIAGIEIPSTDLVRNATEVTRQAAQWP
jgi:hypothetical protein